jgi:hypothetical protein
MECTSNHPNRDTDTGCAFCWLAKHHPPLRAWLLELRGGYCTSSTDSLGTWHQKSERRAVDQWEFEESHSVYSFFYNGKTIDIASVNTLFPKACVRIAKSASSRALAPNVSMMANLDSAAFFTASATFADFLSRTFL